jgi:hypothetical protein
MYFSFLYDINTVLLFFSKGTYYMISLKSQIFFVPSNFKYIYLNSAYSLAL